MRISLVRCRSYKTGRHSLLKPNQTNLTRKFRAVISTTSPSERPELCSSRPVKSMGVLVLWVSNNKVCFFNTTIHFQNLRNWQTVFKPSKFQLSFPLCEGNWSKIKGFCEPIKNGISCLGFLCPILVCVWLALFSFFPSSLSHSIALFSSISNSLSISCSLPLLLSFYL